MYACRNDRIAVNYRIFDGCSILDNCAGEDNAVLDNGSLAYLDRVEKNRIANRSVYLAALGYDRVFDRTAVTYKVGRERVGASYKKKKIQAANKPL